MKVLILLVATLALTHAQTSGLGSTVGGVTSGVGNTVSGLGPTVGGVTSGLGLGGLNGLLNNVTGDLGNIIVDLGNITTATEALDYLLQLKCLQAQFYSWAAFGKGLDSGLLGLNGTLGNVGGLLNNVTGLLGSGVLSPVGGLVSNATGVLNNSTTVPGLLTNATGTVNNTLTNTTSGLGPTVNNVTKNLQAVGYSGGKQGLAGTLGELGQIDNVLGQIGSHVVNKIPGKSGYAPTYNGGQQAQLSWYVQLIAEQLATVEADALGLIRNILGDLAPVCPTLDISADIFNQMIGLVLGPNAGLKKQYSPYADDASFMIAAFLFEDLAVSAEVGIMEQLSVDIGANLGLSVGSLLSVDLSAQVEVDVAAQVLISELLSLDSYAAGLIRGWLFANGASPLQWFSKLQVIELVQKIADWRASLGGGSDSGISIPAFEGGIWIPEVSTPSYKLALAPINAQGLIDQRTPIEVANILFGGNYQQPGLFFPKGWNFQPLGL